MAFDELIRLGWDGSSFRQGITADVNYAIREFERLAQAASRQGQTAKIPVLPPGVSQFGYSVDPTLRTPSGGVDQAANRIANAQQFARLAAIQQAQLQVASRVTGEALPTSFDARFRREALRQAQSQVPGWEGLAPAEKAKFTREFNRVLASRISELTQIFDGLDINSLKSRFAREANAELNALGLGRVQTVTPQAAVASVASERERSRESEIQRIKQQRQEREIADARQAVVNLGREDEIGGATDEERRRRQQQRDAQARREAREADLRAQAQAASAASVAKPTGLLSELGIYSSFDDRIAYGAAVGTSTTERKKRASKANPESLVSQLYEDADLDIPGEALKQAVGSLVKALINIEKDLIVEFQGFTGYIASAKASARRLNAAIDAEASEILAQDRGYAALAARGRIARRELSASADREIFRDGDLRGRSGSVDASAAIAAEDRRRARDRALLEQGRIDRIPKSRRADLGLVDESGAVPVEKQLGALQTRIKAVKAALRDLNIKNDPKDRQVLAALSAQLRELKKLAESGFTIPMDDGVARAKLSRLRREINEVKSEAVRVSRGEDLGAKPTTSGAGAGGGGGIPPGYRQLASSASGGGRPGEPDLYSRVRGAGGLAGFFGTGALSSLRYGVPSALLFGAASGFSQTIREAEEFNLVLTQIEAQFESTFGAGDEQFQNFRNKILQTSRETGLAADQVASLSQQLIGAFANEEIDGQTGIPLIESQQVAAAKLAQVTKLPIEEITDGLTAASLAFNESFERIGDVAIGIQQETGVLAKETISFIGDIAPVAKEAGFSLEEFASIAAIAQQRSGKSGTVLAEQFGRIIPAIAESRDKLFDLAQRDSDLQTPEFIKALQTSDISTIFETIIAKYNDLNTEAQQFVINLLGGRREAAALAGALGNPAAVKAIEEAATDSAGLLNERFERVSESITLTLQRAAEQLKQLGIALLNSGLGDLFVDIVKLGAQFISIITKLIELAGGVNDAFGGWPVKILAAVAAFKLLQSGIGRYGPTVRNTLPFAIGGTGNLKPGQFGLASSGTYLSGLLAQTGGALGNPIYNARTTYQRARAGVYRRFTAPANVPPGFQLGEQVEAPVGRLRAGARAAGTAGAGLLSLVGGWPGLALTGAITAYSIFSSKLADDQANIEEIIQLSQQAGTTADDLEKVAKDLESEGKTGVGWGTAVKSFFTNRPELSEFDIATAQARAKEIGEERRQTYEAIAESDAANKALRGVLVDELKKPELTAAQKRAGYTEAFDPRKFVRDLDSQPFETIGDLGGTGQLFNADANLDKFVEDLAKELGVKRKDLTIGVIQAFASNDPAAKLNEILNDPKNLDTDLYEQAKNAYDKLLAKGSGLPAVRQALDLSADVKEVRVAAQTQTLETIQKNFESGRSDFQTYIEARRRNTDELRRLIDLGGAATEGQLQELLAQEKDLRDTISKQSALELDLRIETIDLGGRGNSESSLRQKIATTEKALSSGKLSGDEARKAASQLIGYQRDLQQRLIENASSAEEAAQLASQGFNISTATRLQLIITGLSSALGVNWERLNSAAVLIFGESADALFTFLLDALNTGKLSVDQVKFILTAKLADAKEQLAIAQYLQASLGGGGSNQQILDLQQLVNGLQFELDNINQEGSFFGDPGATGQTEEETAKKANDEAKNLIQAQARLRKAQAKSNKLSAALIDLQAAKQDYLLVLSDPESTEADRINAQAAIAEQEEAVAAQIKNNADSVRSVAIAFARTNGDEVLAATLELEQAYRDLEEAARTGDEAGYASAQVAIIQGVAAVRDSARSRREALVGLALAIEGDDPVRAAQAELALANDQLSEALGVDQRIEAQRRLVDAQRALTTAMQEVRYSQFSLRQAELEAMDEDAAAAAVAVQLARQQLADAVKRGAGDAELNGLRAQLVTSEKAARDAMFQERYDDYQFMYEMEQITRGEYINYLEGLKSTLIPGSRQFKELELEIKRLKDDISGDLQMNLPQSIKLPTLYEVRRLNDNEAYQGNRLGTGIGYQDNRTITLNMVVSNGMVASEVLDIVSQAIGPGRTGFETRQY